MEKHVQISERLQAVVRLVTKGKVVADVGCDHAYTSIYLIEQGIATQVIALDVNRGPLERAKINIEKYGMQQQIETRLSDGIKELKPGEVHTLLIAGMGGPLMQQILMGHPEVLAQVEELVLQPQSEIREVRVFLEQIGFEIQQEQMLIDDGKYYVMMNAKKVEQPQKLEQEVFYRYGKHLLESKNQCLNQFLQRELENCNSIIQKIQANTSDKSRQKLLELQEDIRFCKEALGFYESGTNYRETGDDSTDTLCGKLG